MNNNSSNKSGISFWTKDEYTRKYFTRDKFDINDV